MPAPQRTHQPAMTPDQRQDFACRLREARERRGLTQADVATALKVGQSRVSEAERLGTSLVRRIDQVAKLLKVRSDWLLWGDGPSPWTSASERDESATTRPASDPATLTLREVPKALATIAKRLRQSNPTAEQSVLCDDLDQLATTVRGLIG
jgi:transcriptional regulator with XRE-family HTH domain